MLNNLCGLQPQVKNNIVASSMYIIPWFQTMWIHFLGDKHLQNFKDKKIWYNQLLLGLKIALSEWFTTHNV